MTYSKKLYFKSTFFILPLLLIISLIIGFSAGYVVYNQQNISIIIIFVMGFLYYPMITKFTDWLVAESDPAIEKAAETARRARLGFEGEDMLQDFLSKSTITKGKCFFNLLLPNGGDIDCLILGEKGLMLIEVKNFRNHVTLPASPTVNSHDPRDQARHHAEKLHEYLQKNGYTGSLRIHIAVLYINKDLTFSGKQNGVYNICGLDGYDEYYRNIPNDIHLTDSDKDKLALLLEKLRK